LTNVNDRTAKVLNVGCENYAIDFGDVIVRFPVDEQAFGKLEFETIVCGKLDLLDLKTPKTKTVLQDYPFSWHQKIQGDYFLTEDYDMLSIKQRDVIAKQLAAFFVAIHSFSKTEMKELGAQDLPGYVAHSLMQEQARLIPSDLISHFDHFMSQYKALSVDPAHYTFGYFDAHGWNMAFDKKSETLIGIYDFADCGFGDVHQDFHPINTISQDLIERVVDQYQALTNTSVNIARVNFYTILAEYSDLFDMINGHETLMQKGLDHHFSQLRRWRDEMGFLPSF